MIVIITLEDIKTEQVDINNIYTESDLDEVIYIQPPEGLKI